METLEHEHIIHYTSDDHLVWAELYEINNQNMMKYACKDYIKGFNDLKIPTFKIPTFYELNTILSTCSTWTIVPVSGYLASEDFFKLINRRKFPITQRIRSKNEIEFSELPDIFHDIMGHVPMLNSDVHNLFSKTISDIALQNLDNPIILEKLSNLYWYTFETGLVKENGEIKIFGGAILTSSNEVNNVFKEDTTILPFDAELIMSSSFDNLNVQSTYFILESFDQLSDACKKLSIIYSNSATK
ncbi:hypothetical protein [Flavobacterium sp.]|uniref:hypothetical protein n=1 Tax=Flavobacterium sp. TaxID=239 RepID=UPI003D1400F7